MLECRLVINTLLELMRPHVTMRLLPVIEVPLGKSYNVLLKLTLLDKGLKFSLIVGDSDEAAHLVIAFTHVVEQLHLHLAVPPLMVSSLVVAGDLELGGLPHHFVPSLPLLMLS